MINQKSITIKTSSTTLDYKEMGDIICNSSNGIFLTLPSPKPGLWYRISNVNSGIVSAYYNSTVLTSLKNTEQCLCLSNGTTGWFFSKGGGAMTKAEIEAVLIGEITSHSHPLDVIISTSAPTTATQGKLGQLFLNKAAPKLYQCTNIVDGVYTWVGIVDTYILPLATATVRGGIIATERTTESQEVKIDTATGKLYTNAPDEAVNGVPTGGMTNQILAKNSDNNYDIKWVNTPEAANGLPSGGTINQILVKASPDNYDSLWQDFSIDIQEEFNYNSASGSSLVSVGKSYTKSAAAGGSYYDSSNVELTDGVKQVSTSYSNSSFSGYQNVNLEVVIDLGENKNVEKCILYGIKATSTGIYTPQLVEIMTSTDNINFSTRGSAVPTSDTSYTATITFAATAARYVKFFITRGGEWTFLDELEVYASLTSIEQTGYKIGGGVCRGPALPIANSNYRGMIFTVEGATGSADVSYICKKTSNDTYSWAEI